MIFFEKPLDDLMNTIGNLKLISKWRETAVSEHWIALEDARPVWVERLTDLSPEVTQAQLGNFRLQLGYQHPRVSRVTRILDDAADVLAVRELLEGVSIHDLLATGKAWQNLDLLDLLIGVAEVGSDQEKRRINTQPLSTRRIFWNEQMGALLDNTVQVGFREAGRTKADIAHFGMLVESMVIPGERGSNRVITLCRWMQGYDIAHSLSWLNVWETAGEILEQLQA